MKPYYENEHGQLYNCDFYTAELQLSANLMLTDPPYGTTSQKWDTAPDWCMFFNKSNQFIKQTAPIVFTMTHPQTSFAIVANIQAFKYAMVWLKNKATGHLYADKRPMRIHEDILVFCDGSLVYNPQPLWNPNMSSYAINQGVTSCYGGQRAGSIYEGSHERKPKTAIYCPVVNNDDPERIHTNQKPVGLWEYLVKTYSNVNDTVFDPFAGGGTTAIAAQNCGRRWVLFEQSESDCEKIASRLEGCKPHLISDCQQGWEDFLQVEGYEKAL